MSVFDGPTTCYEWFDLSSRPLLRLALENAKPAHSVTVEWLVDRIIDGAPVCRALTNYTQILRVSFSPKQKDDGTLETFAEAAKRAGEQILDDAEKVLWYGKPFRTFRNGYPLSMCGGVLHYLRRRVYENDTVALRELSPLMLRDFSEYPEVGAAGEWLMEISLQVNPGHYQRGMKPVCLPPAKSTKLNAHAEGAALEV